MEVLDLPTHYARMRIVAWSFTQARDASPLLSRFCSGHDMTDKMYYGLHFLVEHYRVGRLRVYSSGLASKRRLFVVAATSGLHLQPEYQK